MKQFRLQKETGTAMEDEFPVALKAHFEFSGHEQLFRLAFDRRTEYMVLIREAFNQLKPGIDWYLEQNRFDDAITFIENHCPIDCVEKVLGINSIINKKKNCTLKNEEPNNE